MLSQKISFKSTLAQIYQGNYSDIDVSQLSQFSQSKISFFTQFQRMNKMISCQIQSIETVPKQSFHRAYTLYRIDILTEQLYFTTQKRYSQFQKLNKRIKKSKRVQLRFPRKTYLQSGTQVSVTSQRISLFNQYVDSILQLGDQLSDIKFMFFQFIGLWDKYVGKGIDINNGDCEYSIAGTHNIYIQILKLNENPRVISSTVERIRRLMFNSKTNLSLQVTRQLFFGVQNNKKGLLAFAFDIENQYVAIKCLQLIVDLLDPQLSKSSQLFLKTLQTTPIKRLTVNSHCLLQNLDFKRLYFEVLKLYQSKPPQKDLKSVFTNSKQTYKQYIFWHKSKNVKHDQPKNILICASTCPSELFDQIQCKRSFQKVKNEIEQATGKISEEELQDGTSKEKYLTQNRKCILFDGDNYIGFKSKFPKELREKVESIDRAKWHTFQEQMQNKYTDVITKTLNFKQQRRFKFNQNFQEQNDQITLQPIHTDHFDDCFFQFSQVIEKDQQIEVIQIIYFCHNNSHEIKRFLREKLQLFWIQKVNQ